MIATLFVVEGNVDSIIGGEQGMGASRGQQWSLQHCVLFIKNSTQLHVVLITFAPGTILGTESQYS